MKQRLDEIAEEYVQVGVVPAVGLTVMHRGELVLDTAWGWIDPHEQQYPVLTDTLFDLASLTKPFIATAFLALVSAGKVGIDDPVTSVVPEFGEANPRGIDGGQDPLSHDPLPVPDELRGQVVDPDTVTFRHLLNHTSGMAPWRSIGQTAGSPPLPPDAPDPVSRRSRWARAVGVICGYPFVGLPGERVRYSDLGFMLLGEAVSRLQDAPLDMAVQALVSDPLGLESLIYNPVRNGINRVEVVPTEEDVQWRGRRCWGEVHDENAAGVGGVAGHAGLFAHARDIASFGQAWLAQDSRLGIKPAIMTEAVRHQVGGEDSFRLGYGWMLRAVEGSSAGEHFSMNTFGHTGFTGTTLWVDPEKQLVVALLTNRVYPGRDKIAIHALRRDMHDAIAQALLA